MKFYCWGRFLGHDKYCNSYNEQGCDLGYAFKKDEEKTLACSFFLNSRPNKSRTSLTFSLIFELEAVEGSQRGF